jgi:hypothetical protein
MHAGKDVAHPPEVDVAVKGAGRVALDPQLDEDSVLDDGDAALAGEAVEQQAAAQARIPVPLSSPGGASRR